MEGQHMLCFFPKQQQFPQRAAFLNPLRGEGCGNEAITQTHAEKRADEDISGYTDRGSQRSSVNVCRSQIVVLIDLTVYLSGTQ